MAQRIDPVIKPPAQLRRVISRFHQDTLDQLEENTRTQHIFPEEVYPGYKQVNEYRKRHGGWYSTGQGVKSFRGRIVSADDLDDIYLTYTYRRYLKFAELGVGAGVSASDVERAKNAFYSRRYIGNWNRGIGRSHRPAIRMEFNHLASRIESYLCRAYGEQIKAQVTMGLTVDIDVQNALRMYGMEPI